jgi:hypothetical protein
MSTGRLKGLPNSRVKPQAAGSRQQAWPNLRQPSLSKRRSGDAETLCDVGYDVECRLLRGLTANMSPVD